MCGDVLWFEKQQRLSILFCIVRFYIKIYSIIQVFFAFLLKYLHFFAFLGMLSRMCCLLFEAVMLLRGIRSFVKRKGRSSVSTIDKEALMSKYGVSNATFSQTAPLILEIGFGMGDPLLTMAKENPDYHYIGAEVHEPGIVKLLSRIVKEDVSNITIFEGDVVPFLREAIPNGALSGVQIFFPDPWPKKRHHKRRLIQPDFVTLLVDKLVTGGFIHLATDWEDYANHMLTVMNEAPSMRNLSMDNTFIERPLNRPLTKFEERGIRLGHGVWDLKYIKQSVTPA
jgi:tRNA (guanine-N7-)-methyltransferase